MKVEVYPCEAKAAVKNKQKPEYTGKVLHYSTGLESDTVAVVENVDGFLEDVWIGRLRTIPVTVPANKK